MASKTIVPKVKSHLERPGSKVRAMCGLMVKHGKHKVTDRPASTTCKTCRSAYDADPVKYRRDKKAAKA